MQRDKDNKKKQKKWKIRRKVKIFIQIPKSTKFATAARNLRAASGFPIRALLSLDNNLLSTSKPVKGSQFPLIYRCSEFEHGFQTSEELLTRVTTLDVHQKVLHRLQEFRGLLPNQHFPPR
jgi:hypothetical protein